MKLKCENEGERSYFSHQYAGGKKKEGKKKRQTPEKGQSSTEENLL